MVVLRSLAPAVVSAACLWQTVHALHIDVSNHGDVSIDLDLDLSSDLPVKLSENSRSSGHALGKDEDLQLELRHGTHQGRMVDDGVPYVLFSNIPYAAPPNETETRWAPPYDPYYGEGIYNDSGRRVCPQIIPGWVTSAAQFLTDFGDTDNKLDSKWKKEITPADYPAMSEEREGNEDCLYLDVHVPRKVWDARNNRRFIKPMVVVHIHGGGFVYGSKYAMVSPGGLFKAANETEEDNIIYVSINYRLGMFGWLAGTEYQKEASANLGLQDQYKALEWVQNNIFYFGGDPRYVTVMGQSAGGASIQHLLTSELGRNRYGSEEPLPFKKAVIQSPGFFPQLDSSVSDDIYKKILSMAGAKDLDALAAVNATKLMEINARLVHNSSYGQFTFGPTVDGNVMKRLPGVGFGEGSFKRGVAVLTGYTAFDGLIFTPPWIRKPADLKKFVRSIYKSASDAVVDKIAAMYPIGLDDGGGDLTRAQIVQVSNMLNEVAIKCNVYAHSQALVNDKPEEFSYRYVWNAPPALHGSDLNYVYYPKEVPGSFGKADATLANTTQTAFVDFIRYYSPNDPELENEIWKEYKNDTRLVAMFGHKAKLTYPKKDADFEFAVEADPMTQQARERCDFWIPGPYKSSSSESERLSMLQAEL